MLQRCSSRLHLALQVILIDSAGLRQTDCPIEAEGMRRAVAAAQQAHVVVHVADAASAAAASGSPWAQLDEQQEGSAALPLSPQAVQMWVLNKADLLDGPGTPGQQAAGSTVPLGSDSRSPLLISCQSGQGIAQLLDVLRLNVKTLVARGSDDSAAGALVTRARHRWVGEEAWKQGCNLLESAALHKQGWRACLQAPPVGGGGSYAAV